MIDVRKALQTKGLGLNMDFSAGGAHTAKFNQIGNANLEYVLTDLRTEGTKVVTHKVIAHFNSTPLDRNEGVTITPVIITGLNNVSFTSQTSSSMNIDTHVNNACSGNFNYEVFKTQGVRPVGDGNYEFNFRIDITTAIKRMNKFYYRETSAGTLNVYLAVLVTGPSNHNFGSGRLNAVFLEHDHSIKDFRTVNLLTM